MPTGRLAARLTQCILLCGALLAAVGAAAATGPRNSAARRVSGAPIDYATQIQPLLQAHCYQCHGPDNQAAGLRLDTRKLVIGRVVVPGNSSRSLLVKRLLGQGGAQMPLGFSPLPADQVQMIRRWIDSGAAWPEGAALRKHWAYITPVRPALPAVRDAGWVKNPIDRFVLARLEKENLKPSPEAEPAILIRRVYLDLTGLPPRPQEVESFVADRSPGAYEKVVDGLLASPHYGERMARPWLDLARYADTNGYEKDNRRSIWPYRDWVINAFNQDMPFDEFTIEQLAGDMLPGATLSQKIATGFHRNTMKNEEGGVDAGEQRWLTLVDRANTTASVWLGSTLGCAECHNHKYDPFTQKEYYQLLAFFENADEPDSKVPAVGNEPEATTLVMQERPTKETPSTYIRIKGSYLNRGEKVYAGTPAVLPPLPAGQPVNRLTLARWLVSPQNPLTARVTVNRFWEQVFGRGLVETVEDFGTQGDVPTHPRLLDWLATEFVRQHWSMKAIMRLLVTSATYRQSSRVTPALLEKDPANRLLARGPRFRMEGEMIRDAALSCGGLLSDKLGGPSVFPLQPDGIWSIPYNADQWVTSKGPDQYRRAIYTFWRRTSPYPALTTFDAPTREYCTVRRIRTNTPLQALTTLNDEAFFVAARGMARRMQREGGPDTRSQIAYGFRLCVSRRPTTRELSRLQALYAQELAHFRLDGRAAGRLTLAATGRADAAEPAAMTVVANVLLNLDETLTKE